MVVLRGRWRALIAVAMVVAVASVQEPQDPQRRPSRPLGPGPGWRGPVRPSAHNEVFATGDGCAMCHSASSRAEAMRGPTGEDVSPHGLWQATMMANSFRDPYWRAQVAKEISLHADKAGEVQALCLRCHAPMHHHSKLLGGEPPSTVAQAAEDPLARDGVSCTVCHQITDRNLGQKESWSGRGHIAKDRTIYGPFAEPEAGPMVMMSRYAPVEGEHVSTSALCATCHTLFTSHTLGAGGGDEFPEQSPYLEWRNSVFNDEQGASDETRTCQQCHMADVGATRIARNPAGFDFVIPARDPYRAHAFVGGNAFQLELMARHRERLGVQASAEALTRMAHATRRQLTTATVAVQIGEVHREQGELRFAVRVQNLTGHKFPSGYPSRRAWLHVQVRQGNRTVFDCGGFTADGDIAGIAHQHRQPHVTEIRRPQDVLVWEMVALDVDGEPTTSLVSMARRGKDNRLLPRGYSLGGPHVDATAPVGVGNDIDFTGGGDGVQVAIPYAADAPRATVVVWVHYQTIPPHWVAALRSVDADECRTYVELYDSMDKAPETIAVVVAQEER